MIENITAQVVASLLSQGRDLDQLSSFAEDAESNVYFFDFGDECSDCTSETGSPGVLTQFNTGEVYRLVYIPDPLPGDYNDDGRVDVADYTVWRDNLGAEEGTLPNDFDSGAIGQAQYDTWQTNFGTEFPDGTSIENEAVAEPTSLLLASMGIVGLMRRIRQVVGGRLTNSPAARLARGRSADRG